MKRNKKILIYFTAAVLIFSAGCMEINEEFSQVRNEIIDQLDDDYKSEVQFSIGSVGITISSWFVDFATDEEFIDDMLQDISGVQLGVYERVKGTDAPDLNTISKIESEMNSYGWKSVVRTTEEDEVSAVYFRVSPDELLERIFVVSLSEDELVLVEVEGDLKSIITTVIRDKGLEFERI